jgi:uncharacterized protein YdeI (YjbR/CyaY-like superfamily)
MTAQRRRRCPSALAAALAKNSRARAFFENLDATNRYAILYRVTTAKLPETRAKRIATFVAMCAAHQTLHPARSKARARSQHDVAADEDLTMHAFRS